MKSKKKNTEEGENSLQHPIIKIKKLKKDLSMFKIVNSKGYLKETHRISKTKKEIARLLTEQNKLKKKKI